MKVSVCMATYNGERYLAEQIDSILGQLRAGDELLVADDGSRDGTLALLQRYGDRLRIVARDRAGGVVPNFARVLAAAACELILLADQDDVWLPGRLETMRERLDTCDLVMTNAAIVNGHLVPTGATLFEQVRPTRSLWRNVFGRSSFVGCCLGMRRAIVARALPLPACTPWHDWLIGLLASVGGRVEFIEQPMLLFRRHGANASATGATSSYGWIRKLTIRAGIVCALVRCLLRRPAGRLAR